MLSFPHLVVIFLVALVVFGPEKLPELARTLGRLMADFRKASGDFQSTLEAEMHDLERQARDTQQKIKAAVQLQEPSASTAPMDAPKEAGASPEGVPREAEALPASSSETTPPQKPASPEYAAESADTKHAAHDDRQPV
ncbi:MAG TPA: twin-arginine translocase TatA/TatE family subunit [Candidatus Acidoferrales bacterium]